MFGLTSQVRRSASSVPANIAEGFGRGTTREFLHFLRIARGSVEETRYFMILSRDRRYITEDEFQQVSQLRFDGAVTECASAITGASFSHESQVTSHESRAS